jgi:hypothetical protein
MHRFTPLVLGLLITACSAAGTPSPGSTSALSSDPPGSQAASATAAASQSASASPEPAAGVAVDSLARTAVDGLSVREEPSTAAARRGTLPAGATAFVIDGPVEAEGYTWYHLAGIGMRSEAACSAEVPPFECTDWVGWAAGTTPEGDSWLDPVDPDCPTERDTTAYLSMDASTRLACAGDDEWRLVAYLAPMAQGRGCFPVWIVDPFWMDSSCVLFFPQPDENQFDDDTSIQAFIPPELGECGPGGCPFDDLKGSWVEIVGHLDDPAAETCTTVLNETISEAPYAPPDPDWTIFRCRLNFVVTELTETTPPSP